MPITKSAKKALRASRNKRQFNIGRLRAMKESIKGFKKAPQADALARVYKAIDKAAKRGIIKKATAARRKAGVAKLVAGKK